MPRLTRRFRVKIERFFKACKCKNYYPDLTVSIIGDKKIVTISKQIIRIKNSIDLCCVVWL